MKGKTNKNKQKRARLKWLGFFFAFILTSKINDGEVDCGLQDYVLVDTKRRIRDILVGTNLNDIDRLKDDIKTFKKKLYLL
jgi:hypothetical protein